MALQWHNTAPLFCWLSSSRSSHGHDGSFVALAAFVALGPAHSRNSSTGSSRWVGGQKQPYTGRLFPVEGRHASVGRLQISPGSALAHFFSSCLRPIKGGRFCYCRFGGGLILLDPIEAGFFVAFATPLFGAPSGSSLGPIKGWNSITGSHGLGGRGGDERTSRWGSRCDVHIT